MPSKRPPTTEILRLPGDVTRAIRLRAATQGITLSEAARQLIAPREAEQGLGLLEHVQWLRGRLMGKQEEVEQVFAEGNADPDVVGSAIHALLRLADEWPEEELPSSRAAEKGLL